MAQQEKVHLISLGCPKNRVDSEVMLGQMRAAGYEHTTSPEDADVIVVNTCGFIDAAKEESIDTILEMEDYKANGRCQKLVVTGCLSQRYAPDLAKEIPSVDHFLGTGNFQEIAQVLGATEQREMPATGIRSLPILKDHPRLRGANKLVPYRYTERVDGKEIYIPDPTYQLNSKSPRLPTQASYSQYLKISEGCSNTCAFCIIPKLRGPQRSRTIADIVEEAWRLREAGAVELNLIAQDLCAFGRDRDDGESLGRLLRELNRVGEESQGPLWIRCLYAYPKGLTDEVIKVMGESQYILPYLDMPLQHISDRILRAMRRGKGGDATWQLLRKLRQRIPELTLRTTFITGLPGETEADFGELCRLVEELRFEQMGVFSYSPEADTPAADFADQVPRELADNRRARLLAIQQDISRGYQESLHGKTLEVLVEGVSDETDLLLQGRHKGQAPEIDGITLINDGQATVGQVVKVQIEDSSDYDLVGGIVD
ncbi:MAG: 30S ribosomal protein S12 methylthiotransferase RimO [Myxococcota bacterium]|nr:30S ribosomal protein S12 methylthiotransferase RimO [Myxococcota bacterium]